MPNPVRASKGAIAAMPHYAGESVASRAWPSKPAADIVRELVEQAERLLRRPWG